MSGWNSERGLERDECMGEEGDIDWGICGWGMPASMSWRLFVAGEWGGGVEAWVEDGVSMYGFIGSVVRCMGSTWRVRDG